MAFSKSDPAIPNWTKIGYRCVFVNHFEPYRTRTWNEMHVLRMCSFRFFPKSRDPFIPFKIIILTFIRWWYKMVQNDARSKTFIEISIDVHNVEKATMPDIPLSAAESGNASIPMPILDSMFERANRLLESPENVISKPDATDDSFIVAGYSNKINVVTPGKSGFMWSNVHEQCHKGMCTCSGSGTSSWYHQRVLSILQKIQTRAESITDVIKKCVKKCREEA